MVQKSDGLGLRMEITTVQMLDPAIDVGKSMCVNVLIKWLWWLRRNTKEGISMKDQASRMKTRPGVTLEIEVWDLVDSGGKWVTRKSFRIKLMLLLWILLSRAALLWGCPDNFWIKAWTHFLAFCLFMTWCRSIYCQSGCIFLCSFKQPKCLFQNLPFEDTNVMYFPCTSTMFVLFPFSKSACGKKGQIFHSVRICPRWQWVSWNRQVFSLLQEWHFSVRKMSWWSNE